MKPSRKNKIKIILAVTGASLAVIIIGLFIYINSITYSPSDQAKSAMESDSQVRVSEVKGGYKFEPVGQLIEPNIIFYPGGLVEPQSYTPFAKEMASLGHRVFIADMPLNLAVLGQNKADSFIQEYPDQSFVIGGHSLGGSMAARYASKHSEDLLGVFFLASYADDGGTLKDRNLDALQITGTADGVLNQEEWEKSKTNLPADTSYVSINGGNHGQFGSYGKQKGDNDPSIGEEEQLESVVSALQSWFEQMP